jgi:hypothetical protein
MRHRSPAGGPSDDAPWMTTKSNDKKRARPEVMRQLLSRSDYAGKDTSLVAVPDPLHVRRGSDGVGD